MANKRTYELDEAFGDLSGFKLLVDKSGNTEANHVDISNLAAYVFALYFQFNTTTVVKGENVISISGQTSSAYKVMGDLRDSDGGVEWYTYDQTATSFKLYAAAAGTFTYLIKNA